MRAHPAYHLDRRVRFRLRNEADDAYEYFEAWAHLVDCTINPGALVGGGWAATVPEEEGDWIVRYDERLIEAGEPAADGTVSLAGRRVSIVELPASGDTDDARDGGYYLDLVQLVGRRRYMTLTIGGPAGAA